MQMTEEQFNKAVPIGTEVYYQPVLGWEGHELTRTRSKAWTMGHGAVVVMVDGHAGGVSIGHVTLTE